jgi:hypothetical protein
MTDIVRPDPPALPDNIITDTMSVIMLSGNAGGSRLTMSVIMLLGNAGGSGLTMSVIMLSGNAGG